MSLHVWLHNFFDPAHFGVAHQRSGVEALATAIELEGFEHHVHTDFTAKFEAVSQGFFWIVDLHSHPIDMMDINTGLKCFVSETVNGG